MNQVIGYVLYLIMRRCYVLFLFILFASSAFGQVAVDPNCWFPQFDRDVDTISRDMTVDPYFGYNLIRMPTPPNDSGYFIAFLGDRTDTANHVCFRSDSPFALHKLSVFQDLKLSLIDYGTISFYSIFGHFHSTRVTDILLPGLDGPRIYWADSVGRYDTSRYTALHSSVHGDFGWTSFSIDWRPFVGRFTSDSLDDIVISGYTRWKSLPIDSSQRYLLLYRGGEKLNKAGPVALDDSMSYWGPAVIHNPDGSTSGDLRFPTSGDFRGIGRPDWLASDGYGNVFHFKNDPPFSLSSFVAALNYDTLLTSRENPHLDEGRNKAPSDRLVARALPRNANDRSVDFMPSFQTDGYLKKSCWIFRGGPDFGKKRLTIDTSAATRDSFTQAEFIIRNPSLYSTEFGDLAYFTVDLDCGDMTGTGRTVVHAEAGRSQLGPFWDLYYVLGDAIDEAADIVMQIDHGDMIAKIYADSDSRADVLFQMFSDYPPDGLIGRVSNLCVFHSSDKIPIRLNPKYSVRQGAATNLMCVGAPNPADKRITLTYQLPAATTVSVNIFDALGRIVARPRTGERMNEGEHSVVVDVSDLPAGSYYYRLQTDSGFASGAFVVVK